MVDFKQLSDKQKPPGSFEFFDCYGVNVVPLFNFALLLSTKKLLSALYKNNHLIIWFKG